MIGKEILEYEASELYKIRHSAAHVMAQAVLELYPDAKLAIGPPTADGFYYDFDLGTGLDGQPTTFNPEDLKKIEKRMRKIITAGHPFIFREISAQDAREQFHDQPYKLELIAGLDQGANGRSLEEDIETTIISTYRHDTFEDLCRGPHVGNTRQIPVDAFRLMSIAGAYWRGDENQPMLQRIYGTAWQSKADLKDYLHQLEEAKKRDHRRLGQELEIFMFDEEVGPGLAIWLPNGEIIVEELEKLAREVEDAAGYQRVRTPHIAKESLYLRSGHLPYYEEDMFPVMERGHTRYYLKPMNCPFHHKIFASKPRSYRDLPLRLAEHGMVYRYEQSGELFGLMRVRANQQNDAHIYCTEAQFQDEFMAVIRLYQHYFELFGIEKFIMRLSKHGKDGLGKKYVDNQSLWLKTEEMVRQAMIDGNVPFVEAEDEAAFYGPKIDVQVWSAVGREFTIATNQVDFAVPPRFNLAYTDSDGQEKSPLCIHRAPLGSHERMVGFLIEYYNGAFPLWLSPEQVRIMPITDDHKEYAMHLAEDFERSGVRVRADLNSDRIGRKIRQAQKMKVPYMVIVGDKELAEGTISVRIRDGRQREDLVPAEFIKEICRQISTRSAELY